MSINQKGTRTTNVKEANIKGNHNAERYFLDIFFDGSEIVPILEVWGSIEGQVYSLTEPAIARSRKSRLSAS